MKIFLAAFFVQVLTTLSFASEDFQARYICKFENGVDVGTITFFGNPVEKVFSEITLNREFKSWNYGATSRSYLYLYDDTDKSVKSYGLEIFNYPASYSFFKLYVYPKHQLVSSSFELARYNCNKR